MLNFLRDGILPRDTKTLKALYQESDFWRLESLKRAIEERHLKMFRHHRPINRSNTSMTRDEYDELIDEMEHARIREGKATNATRQRRRREWYSFRRTR